MEEGESHNDHRQWAIGMAVVVAAQDRGRQDVNPDKQKLVT
jgi:hypothetical protein